MHRYNMQTTTSATSGTGDPKALIVDMPLFRGPVTLAFLWSIMVDFLTCFYHFFYFIRMFLNEFLFISAFTISAQE